MENSPTRATTRQNADGVSPANLAAQKDSSECLRVLCQSWTGVNNEAEKYMESPDSSGNSPDITAIIHDSFKSLIFLNSMQISDARLSEVAQEHDNLACKIALKLTEANLSSINYIIPSPGRESHGSFPSGRADILEEIVRAGQLDLLDKMLGKVTRDNRGVQHMVVGRSDLASVMWREDGTANMEVVEVLTRHKIILPEDNYPRGVAEKLAERRNMEKGRRRVEVGVAEMWREGKQVVSQTF